jgi:hypothetical protein
MSRSCRVSLAATILALPSAALAYRPFDSTDAAVADEGQMEIELGPLGFLREGDNRWLVAPSVILNWGFAPRWELVLEGRQFLRLGNAGSESRLRVDDAALSLKTVLREGAVQEKDGVSLAAEVGALMPGINGESGAGIQGAVIASQRWVAATLHLNAVAAWTRAHELGLFGGVIAEGHDTWTLRPVAEVFVERERGTPTLFSGLAGAIWRVRDDLSLDGAVRLARAGQTDTFEIRAGLTWGFAAGFPAAGRRP